MIEKTLATEIYALSRNLIIQGGAIILSFVLLVFFLVEQNWTAAGVAFFTLILSEWLYVRDGRRFLAKLGGKSILTPDKLRPSSKINNEKCEDEK